MSQDQDTAPWLSRARPLVDALSSHCLHLGISPLVITRSLRAFSPERALAPEPSGLPGLARALTAITLRLRVLTHRALGLRSEGASPALWPSPELAESLATDRQRALDSIAQASGIIRDARATSTVLVESLHAAQPAIFAVIERESSGFESASHPLTHPKKHVEEITRQATDCARAEIERWMRVEGARITAFAVERKLRLATERMESLERYLGDALALSPEELRDELAAMQADALTRAFGVDLAGTDSARTAATALVGAVLSAVLGYVLADVLLYYVLHAVFGFLNPWLLATSVAGAMALYLARGDRFVRQWIRTQVIARLREAFERPEHQKALDEAIDKGLREMLDALAEGFEAAAREAIEAAHARHTSLGDPLGPEVWEEHGHSALELLDQIDALALEIRARTDSALLGA